MVKKIVGLILLLTLATGAAWAADGFTLLTKEDLRAQLGKADVIVLDVRAHKDWDSSPKKIPGAMRLDPRRPAMGAAQLDKSKTYVLYCA